MYRTAKCVPPTELSELLGEEWRATSSRGGTLLLSFMYGQTPLVFGAANPWDAHRAYWESRGCVGDCGRDNLAGLLNSGRDLVDVLAAEGAGLSVLSMRLNDYHHVIPPSAPATTTRHAVANPAFLEAHYDSRCHTSLRDPPTRDWKLAQIRDVFARLEEEGVVLDGFELDLTRGFCFDASPRASASSSIRAVVRALDSLLEGAPLIARIPRDLPLGDVQAHMGTLEALAADGVDGWILGRTVGARNDPINDEISMLTAVASSGLPFWADSFQYDRAVRGADGSTLNLPATFERLISDAASVYARGGTGASLFNFQYYPQHFARPMGARIERVPPPYSWLECLRRPSCVASVGRHYAGRLSSSDRFLVDYQPSAPGGQRTWFVVHPRADLSASSRAAFARATIRIVNMRSDEARVLGATAGAYPFSDDLGLEGGRYAERLYADGAARSVAIPEPAPGLNRFELRCDESVVCDAIDTVELFSTPRAYVP